MVRIDERSTRRRGLPAAAVTLGVLGAAGAAIAGMGARADARDANGRADAIEIIELRADLRRTHLHETNTMLLREYGVATDDDVEAARDARIAARAVTLERSQDIGRGSGPAADEARFLRDLLASDGLDGVREADPGVLLETGHQAVHAGRAATSETDDESSALYDLMLPDVAGALVLNDALDAAYVLEQPDLPAAFADYVQGSESYLLTDGGYLGPDPEAPLTGSWVYEQSATMPSPRLAEVNDGIAASGLWAYDQWIRAWQQGDPGEAPISLAELAMQARLVDGNTRGIVDTTLRDAVYERRAAGDAHRQRSQFLFSFAAMSGLLAVAGGVAALGRLRRPEVTAPVDDGRDPLTGLCTRDALARREAPAMRDPALGWHLVASIDMDRLGLINATWGDAVGDRVLVEVGGRLAALVADLEENDDILSGSVARAGGDEFLLVLHSVKPLELDTVEGLLDEIRSDTIPAVEPSRAAGDAVPGDMPTDERVPLAFRVGVATATEPCEFDELARRAALVADDDEAWHATSDQRPRELVVATATSAGRVNRSAR